MKNTFNMDLAVEESVTKWLEKNYFATNWWEGQYEIIDDMSNQHRGIDLKLRNEKILVIHINIMLILRQLLVI